ncbi:MAG: hypothetical protein ACLQEI_06860 [Terriglobales bacterium]
MNFKTAQEFYDFCVQHVACEEGLAEIKGLTLADWWDKTKRGDYMGWLRENGVWKFPAPIDAKYEADLALIDAKYWADRAPIDAKYRADLAPIDAKYWADRAPIDAKYWADLVLINAKHRADLAPINTKYWADHATLIRSLIGNPFREATR